MKRIKIIVEIIVFICIIGAGIAFYLNQKVTDYYYLDYTSPDELGSYITFPVCRIIKEPKSYNNDSIAYWSLYESHSRYMEEAQDFIAHKSEILRKTEEHSGKSGLDMVKAIAYEYEVELKSHHSLLIIRRPRYANDDEVADSIRNVWPDSIHHLYGADILYYPFD